MYQKKFPIMLHSGTNYDLCIMTKQLLKNLEKWIKFFRWKCKTLCEVFKIIIISEHRQINQKYGLKI